MKRKITFLIAAIAAILLITQPMIVVGQEKTEVTYTHAFTTNLTSTSGDNTLSGIVWTASNASNYYNYNSTYKGIQLGTSSSSGSITLTTKQAWGTPTGTYNGKSKIKYVYVWLNAGSGTPSASVTIGGVAATSDNATVVKNSSASSYTDTSKVTFTPGTNGDSGVISITVSTSSKAGYWCAIQVVCEEPPTTFNVTYDDNDATSGTVPTDATNYTSGATVTVKPNSGSLEKTGHTFAGWNTLANGTGTTYSAEEPYGTFTISANTTLYAKWNKNNYTVTLGTPANVDLSATDMDEINIAEGGNAAVPFGTVLYLSAANMGSGKMFAWSVTKTEGGDDVTATVLSSITAIDAFLTVPDYPVTVSGTVEDIKYYVTYNANGGTGTLVDPDSPYTPGEDVTVLANTFTYSGHVFTKWTTEAGGGGSEYDAGDEISDIDADVTLYAQWADAWTVTLNSNAVETISEVEKEHSIVLTVPDNIPDGYVYKGWTGTPSTPNIMVNTTFTPTKDTTLYAVFAKEVQEYAENTVILDGSTLPSTATTEVTTQTIRGFNYKFGIGAKSIASSGSNRFTNTAIFTPDYFYNEDGFGTGITKVEIYARESSSISATCGIKFSSSAFNPSSLPDSYDWTKTFSTVNSVYEVNYTIPNGSKYMYYQSTDKNNQVQLRITYVGPVYYTRIYPSGNITPDEDMTITTPTVISNGTVLDMGTHTLSIGAGGSLTIEDGGQLVASNSVAATVKKTIADPAKTDYGHWYTISTPVHKGSTNNVVISETNLISMGSSKYDMFYLNEAEGKWMNQKEVGGAAGFSNMYVGQGYLYRNDGTDLVITGKTNVGDEITYTLTKTGSTAISGFNLIGNPFPHNIYKGTGTAIPNSVTEGYELANGFYTLTDEGAWHSCTDNTTPIAPYQGVLVQATTAGTITFTDTDAIGSGGSKSNNDNIKFVVSNSQYEDVTYALFDKGFGLSKIDHRNADIPMLYINQNDEDYAIATMDDNTKSFNLNLKAKTTGKYTLSYKADGNFSYLHVIDRLTGEDVDMLVEGEYSFIASPSDAENRFVVRLEYSNGYENSEDSIFAYQSGSDIIVNGEGELQIFDVMGRRVATQYVSGVETIDLQLHGVYIFKLNEKTQKIVVR